MTRIAGFFIGALVGIVLGFGELHWIKKSQREAMMLPVLGVTSIVCGLIGLLLAGKLSETLSVEKQLGIDEAKEGMIKDGRHWVGITKWTDKRNGIENTLLTGRSESGILVSALNNKTIINHNINSASKEVVSKRHIEARNIVFERLKQTFDKENIEDLETLFPTL